MLCILGYDRNSSGRAPGARLVTFCHVMYLIMLIKVAGVYMLNEGTNIAV